MITPKLRQLRFAMVFVLACAPAIAQNPTNSKPIRIFILVEPENLKSGPPGRGGEDLSPAEINQLRSLLLTEIGKLANHKLVADNDKEGRLVLSVVAEKVRARQQTWFVLSSVLTVASADGKTNDFVTHDVVAETSLSQAARVVTLYLQSAELPGMLGLLPK
jgi:hypothetical protein